MTVAGQGPHGPILVVDDDPHLRHLLGGVLQSAGFAVVEAEDGDQVVACVRHHGPRLVLLDLRLGRLSGLEALRALRAAGLGVRVIVLTGAHEEETVVAALEAGADDYVTKPFSSRALLARIQAVLRRGTPLAAGQPLRVGELALDPALHQAWIGKRTVPLTPTEYKLLQILLGAVGRTFTPDELLEQVWGPTYRGQAEIVRANIYRLRHKLEAPGQPRYLHSRRGVGYRLAEADGRGGPPRPGPPLRTGWPPEAPPLAQRLPAGAAGTLAPP